MPLVAVWIQADHLRAWHWCSLDAMELISIPQLCEPNMQPTKIGTALQASVFCRRWRCVLMRSATDIWWGATVSITWAPNNKYFRLSTAEIILKGCRSCLNTTKRMVKHREFSNLCVGGVCILPQISEILPEKRRMRFYSTTDPSCSSTKHTLVMSKISFRQCNLALTMSTLSQVCHWSDFPLIFASNSYRTAGLKRGKGSSYSCECCLLSEETCQKCQRRYVLSSICFSLSSAEAIRSSFILQSTREPYPARRLLNSDNVAFAEQNQNQWANGLLITLNRWNILKYDVWMKLEAESILTSKHRTRKLMWSHVQSLPLMLFGINLKSPRSLAKTGQSCKFETYQIWNVWNLQSASRRGFPRGRQHLRCWLSFAALADLSPHLSFACALRYTVSVGFVSQFEPTPFNEKNLVLLTLLIPKLWKLPRVRTHQTCVLYSKTRAVQSMVPRAADLGNCSLCLPRPRLASAASFCCFTRISSGWLCIVTLVKYVKCRFTAVLAESLAYLGMAWHAWHWASQTCSMRLLSTAWLGPSADRSGLHRHDVPYVPYVPFAIHVIHIIH